MCLEGDVGELCRRGEYTQLIGRGERGCRECRKSNLIGADTQPVLYQVLACAGTACRG